ncbi:MAG: DUF1573 domain-containing protein [Clostridiales bacterium]|jgi:hypothetical protein|nr:DUF1573 domain-containing protein [Clostridiales bacterium]
MKDILYENFQSMVAELLSRHKSILDIMSKLQESNARVNRSVAKAVTSCGCIQIDASKQNIPADASIEEIKVFTDDHIRGKLCEKCRDIIEKELGNHMFYIASLANTLDISLYDVIVKEEKSLSALGKFHLK